MTMPIYESAEDYLESILMIEEKKGVVHGSLTPLYKGNFNISA